jgi:hypothetical protein
MVIAEALHEEKKPGKMKGRDALRASQPKLSRKRLLEIAGGVGSEREGATMVKNAKGSI